MGFTLCKFTWLGYGIHLITTASVIKRYLSLYEFTLWGQDLVSIVRIRESILKKIYENFVGTLETVHNIEVSVLEKCPYNCSRGLVGEREIHLWCVYVLHKMCADIWKLSEANYYHQLESLHLEYVAENILSFFFGHLKGVRNLHLGGYSVHNPFIKVYACQFIWFF